MKRLTKLNDNFFENINSEESAYFLGFIYADGNIFRSKKWNSSMLSVCQSEKDVDILQQLKESIATEKKIREFSINGSNYFNITLNSVKMCSDLERYGVVENKSLIIKFPNFIDDNLMHHFIRGYFDGDGCIWDGKRKTMTVKDPTRKCGYRDRVVHNVKITFTGSETFIPSLQEYLISHVGLRKTKLNYSKSKTEHKHCVMEYSGRVNILKLYKFMYEDATVYGKRKKEKFEKILNYGNDINI